MKASVLVEKTSEFTVELWFKPDVSKAVELGQQGITYLYTMQDSLFSAMTIFIENGVLKCSPLGLNRGYDLVYEGVRPLETDSWQHISCMFSHAKFVKGQYLAVNMDPETQDDDFAAEILKPKSFFQEITDAEIENPNISFENEWDIILGNSAVRSQSFYGSLKDVRLWRSLRSDGQLYSHRFRQIDP